ncbi:MAG: NUDIX hydrolase [Acidimicrobiales bacterium]|nr:MAG: NUDIX hydrolase [Acidimicrobiales bacterium]
MDEQRWAVSAKAVVMDASRVLLLQNDRGDWELPGGRVDADDASIESALAREVEEEAGLVAEVGRVCHAEIFAQVGDGRQVIIVAYDARVSATGVTISDEHVGAAWVALDALAEIDLPAVYHRAIEAAPRSQMP